MKNVLTPKKVILKLEELSFEVDDFKILFDEYRSNAEGCGTCEDGVFALTAYNYIIYILKFSERDIAKKILDKFGDDVEVVIGGKLYSRDEILDGKFEKTKKKMPPVLDLLLNFFRSVSSFFIKFIVKRELFASRRELKKRLIICKSCSEFDVESERCSVCGCYVGIKTKFKYAECPREKW